MTRTSSPPRGRRLGLALLLGTAAVAPIALPAIAQAQSAGVDALVKQAQYWRSKGREDLAQQALRRARALDPNHPALKSAAAAPKPAAPKPAAPKPAPRAAAAPRPAQASPPARTAAATPKAAPRAAAAPAPTSAADRAGRARVSGFDALNDGNLDSAESQFQRALAVNRRDADALGGLGLVRLRQSQFAEAASLLEQASASGKASQWAEGLASARFFAGVEETRALVAQNRLSDAQGRAESLVRSGYKESGPALELLADIYERQGRYADAADLYRQASTASGGSAAEDKRLQLRATRGRALAAAERGDDMGATREFQNGLVLDPADPWIRYEFAQFQIERGRVPEAESLIRSLVTNGQPDSLYAAALLNNDLGRVGEADRLVSMIPEAQRTAPMRNLALGVKTDAAIARARAMAAGGQQGQAISSMRQLGSMASLPAGKQAAVANALYDLGDPQGASQIAENALNGRIDTVEDYEGLIGVLARTGRDDLAQQALQRAGQMAGTSADGQRAYARISAGLMVSQADAARLGGRYAESFDILQQAYAAAPDNTEILSGLARLYQTGGMPAKAAQSYQLVLSRKPGDKDALLGLADTAEAAGDSALSKQAQRQVLQSYGQDYRVRMALANVERARGNERAAVNLLKDARELYARQNGAGMALGGNPFANAAPGGMGGAGNNPFRNQAPAAPAQVNPFALGGGTRLPGAYPQTAQAAPASGYGYGAPMVASAPMSAPTPAGTQTGFGGYASQQTSFAAPDRYASPASVAAPQSAWAAPAPLPGSSMGYGAPQVPVAFAGDPVMTQIQSEIDSLAQDTGPRVDVQTAFRSRSGEEGLSQLDEIKGSAKISTGAAGGRVFAKAEAVVADAGRPTGSGLARFGRNGTAEAQAIVDQLPSPLVNADSQQASGVAFSVGYESDVVQLEAGTTPVGMGKTKFAGRASVSPELSPGLRATAFAEQKPVTDSVVSYAGTRDPVTGERWGQVVRTGAGLGMSYDEDGSGVYGEGRYYRFRGTNVAKNDGFEANVGGYLRAYQGARSAISLGLNVNYQAYDKSQNYFTFGNGGYFSPQSFISVGFPINYTLSDPQWDVAASVTPGFQSYKEDASPLYPTDLIAQAELDSLKALNDDVRSQYDSLSKTGFAVSAQGSLYYKLNRGTRIGGDMSYNTFGNYDEFRSMLGVRQSFGSTGK